MTMSVKHGNGEHVKNVGSVAASLAEEVKLNLVHYNLWTNVTIHHQPSLEANAIISGLSPISKQMEWIVPKSFINKDKDISVPDIESWFTQITHIGHKRPSKVIIAIVNDDSTVVYYNIHDGLVKPKQN